MANEMIPELKPSHLKPLNLSEKKEVRKEAEGFTLQQEKFETARNLTPEEVREHVKRDIVHHEDTLLRKGGESEAFYHRSDMALKSAANALYAETLKAQSPELFERVQNNEQENIKLSFPQNQPTADREDALTPANKALLHEAVNWTPEDAQARAVRDIASNKADDDMAIKTAASPVYAEALKKEAPELYERVTQDRQIPLAVKWHILKSSELPASFHKKFIVSDKVPGQYYFHDRQQQLAFADKGPKLTTEGHQPDVVKSMVELAKEKNWPVIALNGSEEFKREAWLQAKLEGLEVTGFEPKPEDIARLDQASRQRTKNDELSANKPPRESNEITAASSPDPKKEPGIKIPSDYSPSADAIAATEHLHAQGISKKNIRMAMYGIDNANEVAIALGLRPFQARILFKF